MDLQETQKGLQHRFDRLCQGLVFSDWRLRKSRRGRRGRRRNRGRKGREEVQQGKVQYTTGSGKTRSPYSPDTSHVQALVLQVTKEDNLPDTDFGGEDNGDNDSDDLDDSPSSSKPKGKKGIRAWL